MPWHRSFLTDFVFVFRCDKKYAIESALVQAKASQASDVGSIPIARSRSLDDSITLTRLSYRNSPRKWAILVIDRYEVVAVSDGKTRFAPP